MSVQSANKNFEHTVFASALRAATITGETFENRTGRGIVLYLKITAVAGTNPTLNIKLQSVDGLGGGGVDVTAANFAEKTGTGSDMLVVYPGIAEANNEAVSDVLPRRWRIVATLGGTDTPSFTWSLGAVVLQ